ncbi:hypothetical protein FRC17_000397 [Serendipita sp. 399]|nr:hypothetical protein FRC17_000397 [Serendipita sp. 399]
MVNPYYDHKLGLTSPKAAPIDRSIPDENTVAEMYCNEAHIVDRGAVEDWMSSLQTLQTFAAIFSAVLITLIVDSKSLLEQDKIGVLVGAVAFLRTISDICDLTYTQPSTHGFRGVNIKGRDNEMDTHLIGPEISGNIAHCKREAARYTESDPSTNILCDLRNQMEDDWLPKLLEGTVNNSTWDLFYGI